MNDLNILLSELYQVDPDLKNYEPEIINLINSMLKAKPDTQFDENFKQQLKSVLLARINELKDNKTMKKSFFNSLFFWRGFAVVSTVAIIAILVLPRIYQPGANIQGNILQLTDFVSAPAEIDKVQANAFGSLGNQQNTALAPAINREAATASNDSLKATSAVAPPAVGFGGGGGLASGKIMSTDSAIGMIAPEFYNLKYVYKGENFALPEKQLDVLKRIKGASSNISANTFNSLLSGLVDLNKFSSLQVENARLIENKDKGYALNFSPAEGILSIDINWSKWYGPEGQQYKEFKTSDLPPDQTLLDMANTFANTYKIDLSNYGTPYIDKNWYGGDIRLMKEIVPAYLPAQIGVVYPLLINKQEVYEEYGTLAGLRLEINLTEMKVVSAYNLTTQKYQSSAYETIQTKEKILEIAERGGLYNAPLYSDASAQSKILELGTPKLVLMKFWKYEATSSQELLVPAYLFPVINYQDNQYTYRPNIIVPLINDIVNSVDTPPAPVPMPLLEDRPLLQTTPPDAVQK